MKNFTKIKGYENYSINNIGTILNKKKKMYMLIYDLDFYICLYYILLIL